MSESFEVKEPAFTLAFAGGAQGAMVWLTGTISVPEPEKLLAPFFDRVHGALGTSGAKSVVVDVRRLEFISSSAIRPMVDWVGRVRDAQGQRYQLRFITREDRRWQTRLANAIASFAPDVLQVEARST